MSEFTTQPLDISAERVCDWLRGCVAAYVRLPVEEIRADRPLSDYGLDSVYVLSLCAEIEDEYGIEVEPTVMWDHPSLGPLAEALVPLIAAR
ncbi:acyl carrier protein [Streptomyces tsukubensis]|nr:acyl carrier protein [Streptomyces tsukubensis]QFR92240.1 acyl carrier protein [Streptomyces tsukubensis]